MNGKAPEGAGPVHVCAERCRTFYLFAKAEGSYPSPGLAVLFSRRPDFSRVSTHTWTPRWYADGT